MQITELARINQEFAPRIHATGCRDITADMARGFTEVTEQDVDPMGWLTEMFGDAASDEHQTGTPEWEAALVEQAADVTVCPCAKAIGFEFPTPATC